MGCHNVEIYNVFAVTHKVDKEWKTYVIGGVEGGAPLRECPVPGWELKGANRRVWGSLASDSHRSKYACPLHVLSQFHSLRRIISEKKRGRLLFHTGEYQPSSTGFIRLTIKACDVCQRVWGWLKVPVRMMLPASVNDETPHMDVMKTGRDGGY